MVSVFLGRLGRTDGWFSKKPNDPPGKPAGFSARIHQPAVGIP
jgi:hypothetical protein